MIEDTQDFSEIKIVVSNEEQKLVKKFATYHKEMVVSHDDPYLKSMVEQSISDFKGTPEDVVVNIRYVW